MTDNAACKVFRCYVEKRPGFDVAARAAEAELAEVLRLANIGVRLFNRYDIQNLPGDQWLHVLNTVLSEPMCDNYYEEHLPDLGKDCFVLYVEPLPGQYDARADSCEQCVQMLLGGKRPVVRTARVYALSGISETDFRKVKSYLINPVEYREATPDKAADLLMRDEKPPSRIPVLTGFTRMDEPALESLRADLGLAMSLPDLITIRAYFKSENRDPTLTELRVMDTYWSDHCRHTTFNTVIEEALIEDGRVKKAYDLFLSVNGDNQPVTLMRIATAAMRHLRESGKLPMLDVSEENNACTIRIKADFRHGREDWLLFFKNETHNHPTEIEPYGGASTCIGGAIRDPLSGRAYVYQAMRITGSGDPRRPIEDTLPGKLPQRKLTTAAAAGFSAYGNQIGLATGYVKELYHNGYIAKRLETGAVIGAAPASNVRRERPAPGDVVVMLGGRTGRDGIGGATGSSKTHGTETVSGCASEVQKGNAPEERKLQRLLRNPDVTRLIKRCNDFGAGGVSVAVGELAEGLEIDLDALPLKYEGLDGTELSISESQERMALVIAEKDLEAIKDYADRENIEASVIAGVTGSKRLVMMWRGQKIVDIARSFLDTNGAERYAKAFVPKLPPADGTDTEPSLCKKLLNLCGELNFCSQKGLVERFDNSIGCTSVFMPYGGKHALTETQVMASLIPESGARTASLMSCGFDPCFTEADPFAGSAFAVVTSVAKLIASGADPETVHLSLQEYFLKVNDDKARWGIPFSAMLGAFSAQMGLGIAAIGGKDSMSGSFGDLDVPPTLISFAVGLSDASVLISPEFKAPGNPVYIFETPMTSEGLPDYSSLRAGWKKYSDLLRTRKILSAWACETGGVYGGIVKMAFGNMIGFTGKEDTQLFNRRWGSIIFESAGELEDYELLGYTRKKPELSFGESSIGLDVLRAAWEAPLEGIFPVRTEEPGEASSGGLASGGVPSVSHNRRPGPRLGSSFACPKAVIPVFPGTNCEYDTAAAIERAGGKSELVLVRNLTPGALEESIAALEKAIDSSQMLIIPGGFSGADEPDGSGKFIVSLFKNKRLSGAVHDLIYKNDGLVLGICNGFQALVKLGLLPFGKISTMTSDCPTLTFNRIGRHQSRYVSVRVDSTISPWLSKCENGEIYVQPVSHGEGRFTANAEILETLKSNGQIVFRYVDDKGNPSMDIAHNPNGSVYAAEGICSEDGRILGKMAHTERAGEYLAGNIPGNKYLPLFEGGVNYFK